MASAVQLIAELSTGSPVARLTENAQPSSIVATERDR